MNIFDIKFCSYPANPFRFGTYLICNSGIILTFLITLTIVRPNFAKYSEEVVNCLNEYMALGVHKMQTFYKFSN